MAHVLVVDDDEWISWALKKALSQEGHSVAVAATAKDAFARAAERPPGAIVLDVRLPDIDGLQALARLRQLSGNAPVIIVTAFGDLGTAVRAVAGAPFDYLAKPFDLLQLLDAVARALRTAATEPPVVREETPGRPCSPMTTSLAAARRCRPSSSALPWWRRAMRAS
jgi:two-component system nitrogen regulation response regulator GlnG